MTSVAPEVIQNTPKSAPKKTKPKSEKKEKLEKLALFVNVHVYVTKVVRRFSNFATASKHEQAPAKKPSSVFRRGNV